MREGINVGEAVGAAVGFIVGDVEGVCVGVFDGKCVGAAVGAAVGVNVGAAVGVNVGAAVGASVGASAVGASASDVDATPSWWAAWAACLFGQTSTATQDARSFLLSPNSRLKNATVRS